MPPFHCLLSQIEPIVALQSHLGPPSLFKMLSWFGSEEFFLLLIPLFYLCLDRRIGLKLGLLVLTSDTLNLLVKALFQQPRPYWITTRILPLATDASNGFPSSHAQDAVVVWFFLAAVWWSRRYGKSAYALALALILSISLSRVYLGVHYPTDILGGWFLGAVVLLVFAWRWDSLAAWFKSLSAVAAVLVSLLISVLTAFTGAIFGGLNSNVQYYYQSWNGNLPGMGETRLVTDQASAGHSGMLCGLLVGLYLASRHAKFEAPPAARDRLIAFFTALAGILILWKGLAMVLPHTDDVIPFICRFVRYGLLTMWVSYFAPKLLLAKGLLRPSTDMGSESHKLDAH